MKKITDCVMIILLTFVFSICLPAQVTVVGHITAEVVSPLTATEMSQMSFGQFFPETTGGKIILTPQGTLSATGTVDVLQGIHNQGSFFVSGEPNASISIELPSGPATLTNPANSGTLIVTSWISDLPQLSNVIIPQSGIQQMNIGATLVVGTIQNNPVGMYSGTYDITFNYN